MLRDYLREKERTQMLRLKALIDVICDITDEWTNISKEEKKCLRMAKTWGLNAYKSILERQNNATIISFTKSVLKAHVQVVDKKVLEKYNKKLSVDMKDNYELNKDYFNLVELIMYLNCRGCKKKCSECDVFKEFELHDIPSPYDELENNCKYSY